MNSTTNCCANCNCHLSEDVQIECIVHTDGEEATFCHDCWETLEQELREEGWTNQSDTEDSTDNVVIETR